MTLVQETVHDLILYLCSCITAEKGACEPILCRVVTRYDVDEYLDAEPPLTVNEWQMACAHFDGYNPDIDEIAEWIHSQRIT